MRKINQYQPKRNYKISFMADRKEWEEVSLEAEEKGITISKLLRLKVLKGGNNEKE